MAIILTTSKAGDEFRDLVQLLYHSPVHLHFSQQTFSYQFHNESFATVQKTKQENPQLQVVEDPSAATIPGLDLVS